MFKKCLVKRQVHENENAPSKRLSTQNSKVACLWIISSLHWNKIFPHLHEFVNDFGDGKIMFFDH